MSSSTTPYEVLIVQEANSQAVPDELATEEPLEIRVRWKRAGSFAARKNFTP